MHRSLLSILLVLSGWLQVGSSSRAAEDQSSLEPSIKRWIFDWESPSFSARNAASCQLRDAGSQAFPFIVEAIRECNPETVSRGLALLKSSLHDGEAPLKAAARRSLDQIAAGPNTSAARLARQILHDYDRPPSQLGSLPALGAPNFARRINIWTFNGTTTIEAFENDVKIKIQQGATGRIKVDITQNRQGIDNTKKFEGADAAELKKKHPLAHQAYKKYESSLQQARLAARPLAPGIPRALGAVPQFPGIPRAPLLQVQERQIEFLQRLIAQAPTAEAAASLNLQLRHAIDRRDQLQRQLGQNP